METEPRQPAPAPVPPPTPSPNQFHPQLPSIEHSPAPAPVPPQRAIARWIALAVVVLVLATIILFVLIWPRPLSPAPTGASVNQNSTESATVAALKRAQQNTTRKNDAATIAAAATDFMTNHLGSLPTVTGGSGNNLLLCDESCGNTNDASKAKLGIYKAEDVAFQGWDSHIKVPDAKSVYLVAGGECSTDKMGISPVSPTSNRKLAILFAIDAGGDQIEQHCEDL